MDYAKESLKMHYELKREDRSSFKSKGRIAKDALSLAYTPGCSAALPLRFRKILIKVMS